jgi:uncharacterized membrane protein YdjX (TVP38/TMEM64 family)
MLFLMAFDGTRSSGTGKAELAGGMATIVVGVAVIAFVPELRHCVSLAVHGQFAGLRSYIRSLGPGGLTLLLGLMVGHAIVWYPSEIVTATAGYVYGFGPGLALVVTGWLLAALLTYALGRSVGRTLLWRLLGHRFDWLTRTMERGGTSLLLSGRLIPVVPFALLGYAAGATHVNLWRFSWTTVIGYLPLTAAVAYLGAQAQTLSTSDPLLWVAVAVLVLLLLSERFVRRRRRKSRGHGRSKSCPERAKQRSRTRGRRTGLLTMRCELGHVSSPSAPRMIPIAVIAGESCRSTSLTGPSSSTRIGARACRSPLDPGWPSIEHAAP